MNNICVVTFIMVVCLLLWLLSNGWHEQCASYDNSEETYGISHGSNASLTDILNHIRFDRKYTDTKGIPLSQDIKILLKNSAYPPSDTALAGKYNDWSCTGTGESRFCMAFNSYSDRQSYIIQYNASVADWDIIPY
jgi:hypothetical protein